MRKKIYDLMDEILSKRTGDVMFHLDPVKRQEEIEYELEEFTKTKEERIAISKLRKTTKLTEDELHTIMKYFKRLQDWSDKLGANNE